MFKFGDLICYRSNVGAFGHDDPVMYVGACPHSDRTGYVEGDIELFDFVEALLDHKDPAMWQKCTHFPESHITLAGGGFPAITDTTRVLIGGHDITGSVTIQEIGNGMVTFDIPGDLTFEGSSEVDGEIVFEFTET